MLSKQDVERLSQSKCVNEKALIAGQLAKALGALDDQASYEGLEALLQSLARDIAKEVRQAFASNLRSSPLISRDIVQSLLHDIDEVALPFIEVTQVLSETELIEIVQTARSVEHQQAVARRQFLSEQVSHKLVEHALHEDVVRTLVQNETAHLSERTLRTITEHYAQDEPIVTALGARPQVPLAVLHHLIDQVSGEIERKLEAVIHDKYRVSAEQIRSINHQSSLLILLEKLDRRTEIADARELVDTLRRKDQLCAGTVMAALYVGKLHFVLFAISRLSNTASTYLERWLQLEHMPPEFEQAVDKAGLPTSFAQDMFSALRFINSLMQHHVGPTCPRYVPLFCEELENRPEAYPNHRYLMMVLQAHPYAPKGLQ